MVEPSWCHRAKRRYVAMGVGLCGLGLAGCSFVPKSRLDECHRLSQTLQTENDRLKDTTISLRSQNQDLNQRAVDDARRHRVQEEEIQRLVQSVSAYQEDRDKLAVAFERIKSQIRSSVNPVSSGLLKQLQDLAQAHPGWEFDPERGVLTIPAAQLFEAGSDRLRGEAENWLRETAALWKAPEASDIDVLVIGRNETSAVRRTALSPEATRPGSGPTAWPGARVAGPRAARRACHDRRCADRGRRLRGPSRRGRRRPRVAGAEPPDRDPSPPPRRGAASPFRPQATGPPAAAAAADRRDP